MKNKKQILLKVIPLCIIAYALGLKFIPEHMPFNVQAQDDGFYAPHAGYCVPELEF